MHLFNVSRLIPTNLILQTNMADNYNNALIFFLILLLYYMPTNKITNKLKRISYRNANVHDLQIYIRVELCGQLEPGVVVDMKQWFKYWRIFQKIVKRTANKGTTNYSCLVIRISWMLS